MILFDIVSPVLGPREENHIPRFRPLIVITLMDRHPVDTMPTEGCFRIVVQVLPHRDLSRLVD